MFGCRRCSEETNETDPCNAPAREFKAGFQPYKKEQETKPQDRLTPGTDKYVEALNAFVVDLTEEKKITVIQAYVEAFRQGWTFQGIEVDDDLQKALDEAGLDWRVSKDVVVSSEVKPQAQQVKAPESSEASLDEIIKAMQEEQK